MNEANDPAVAVRPMTRADVDAFAGWGRHADPLYAGYNVPALDPGAADALWRHLAGRPSKRRPFAGCVDGRFAAQLMLRYTPLPGQGDIGIAVDPALVGRGVGTRILRAFARYLSEAEHLRHLTLDVAGYNERAIRAYRAAGFRVAGERFGLPDPGMDLPELLARDSARLGPHLRRDGAGWRIRILHMEMRLDAEPFTKSDHA